jgi:CRP-like cAMP-binding protein
MSGSGARRRRPEFSSAFVHPQDDVRNAQGRSRHSDAASSAKVRGRLCGAARGPIASCNGGVRRVARFMLAATAALHQAARKQEADMAVVADPTENHLLASLPSAEFERLAPHLEAVDMPAGRALVESGGVMRHVYFPCDAIVSLLYIMENGDSTEVAVIGFEGIVGVSLLMGGETTPGRALVRSGGRGFRVKSQIIKDEFARSGALTRQLLRYTQALITQMTQTAACNRHHALDQQLCRCLLLSLDRLDKLELTMTQESIANMLGVRREGVTEAALKLQRLGMIRYARGHICVLDRPGLERRACECYGVVKREYERLLPERPIRLGA